MQTPDREPLTIREEARRDLTSRTMSIRAATANEQDRSVEAVLGSETPVEVYDWQTDRVVEEVLVMAEARMPAQLPLLANHNRWSLDSILGSARELRVDGGQLLGRVMFATDPDSQRAWEKVLGGHITDVSIGYRVTQSTMIPAGQSASINGRTFTASPRRALRVSTEWTPKEVSLVPIGADATAKIRADESLPLSHKEQPVDPKLRAYLESIGLRADADAATAQQFLAGLTGTQRAQADAIVNPPTPAPRSDPPPADPPQTPEAIRAAAVTAERDRVRRITEMAGADIPAATVQRAITEGWDDARASSEFLTALRSSRTPTNQPPPVQAGPAIHSRSLEADLSVRSLAAAMVANTGGDPTKTHSYDGTRSERGPCLTQEDADRGERFRRLSAVDLARACVRLDSGRNEWSLDPMDAIRTAVSGAAFSFVFGTSVYARIVDGWNEIADSTGWCASEPDIPNFLQQEDITLQARSQLDRLPSGGTANDATMSDKRETYKLGRYAKKFTVDEQDFISDRLGAILRMPFEMGQAARRLRPDLVYSVLLENPNLVADSGALFNATAVTTTGGHANLGTGALSTTNLATAITAMVQQRIGNVVLNVRPRYLIVPGALQFNAATILTGIALAKTHATKADPDFVPINPVSNQMLQMLQGQPIELVVDDRIGTAGVYDPRTKATRAGSDTNWFLSAGGDRTIRVGTRRGTGGMPVMRQYNLDRGQWGVGWDINYDVCVIVADFPGLYKSTGAV